MFATVWNKEDEKNLSLPQTALSRSFNRLNTWFVSETAGRLPQKHAYEGFGTFFADKTANYTHHISGHIQHHESLSWITKTMGLLLPQQYRCSGIN